MCDILILIQQNTHQWLSIKLVNEQAHAHTHGNIHKCTHSNIHIYVRTTCKYTKNKKERNTLYLEVLTDFFWRKKPNWFLFSMLLQTERFLSDIGGTIGLWIGASILGLCELIELVILLLRHCYVYQKKVKASLLESLGSRQRTV